MADGEATPDISPDLKPGDLCHHGSNALPLYRVIWIDGDKVWLRDVNNGSDAVVERCDCQLWTEAHPGHEPPDRPRPHTWPDGTPRP